MLEVNSKMLNSTIFAFLAIKTREHVILVPLLLTMNKYHTPVNFQIVFLRCGVTFLEYLVLF